MTFTLVVFYIIYCTLFGEAAQSNKQSNENEDYYVPIIVPTQRPYLAQQRYHVSTDSIEPNFAPYRTTMDDEYRQRNMIWVAPSVPSDELEAPPRSAGWVAPSIPGDETAPPTKATTNSGSVPVVAEDTLSPTRAFKSRRPHKFGEYDDDTVMTPLPTLASREHKVDLTEKYEHQSIESGNIKVWYLSGFLVTAVLVVMW